MQLFLEVSSFLEKNGKLEARSYFEKWKPEMEVDLFGFRSPFSTKQSYIGLVRTNLPLYIIIIAYKVK